MRRPPRHQKRKPPVRIDRTDQPEAPPSVPPPPIEVVIERIIPGGYGLGHADGQTVMIPLTAPGDRVLAVVERKAGTVRFARLIEVQEPGPDRIAPPCRYFGVCGGCDFQQLDYPAQLAAKSAIITDCLRRIAGISVEGIVVVPSPAIWAYRARAEWQVDPVRGQFGYFERGSHRVCDVEECAVLTPGLQETLSTLRQRLDDPGKRLPAGEIRAADGEDGVAVAPSSIMPGSRFVDRRVGEFRYRFGPDSFFQANASLLPALIEAVAGSGSGRLAVDLYCGVGLFSLPLTSRFELVLGVESDAAAVGLAQRNAADADITNVTFHGAPVEHWLREESPAVGEIDLLVLDPPRTGAGRETIAAIIALQPRRIVYVSCDPATLARDTRQLLDAEYEISQVIGFDLFPQTHHVETVAVFERPTSDAGSRIPDIVDVAN